MPELKEKLCLYCLQILRERRELLRAELSSLKSSMENETKSSVGDKHETARARMQAEEETIQVRMLEAEDHIRSLERGDAKLIRTDSEQFLIVTALGKVTFEGQNFYAISAQSPIGKELRNCITGQTLLFNNRRYRIIDVS